MDDETDSIDQLDSEEITFTTTSLGGMHLDRLDDELSEISYDNHPVRITIEPENKHSDDHHYRATFDHLEYDGRGNYVPDDLTARMDGLEEHIREHDALVPTEVHNAPDIGRNANGFVTFEVEADRLEVDGPGREHTEYRIPDDIIDLVHDYGGEIRDVSLCPDGRGWGKPTYIVGIVVE